jgi:hypothetical protein
MNENAQMVEESFYKTIAELLGCDTHDYKPYPYSKRTRWNNRSPGNGRYLGHGVIKRYNSTVILVNLHTPHVVGYFTNEQTVFDTIKTALKE